MKTLKIAKRGSTATEKTRQPLRGRNRNNQSSIPPRSDSTDRSDKPQRSFNDKPRHDNSDRPARPSGDRPQRSFNDTPANPYGQRPQRASSDTPRRANDERPRAQSERPANPYGDRPRRHMVQEPRRHGKVRDDIKPRSAADKAASHPQVQSSDGIRLSKHLSDTGVCSRREADQYIERGWVTVNGQRAVLGQRILPTDRVQVAKQVEQAQDSRVTILINKPVGIVSGQAEDGYEPAIALVTPDNQWTGDNSARRFEHSHIRNLAPAGRLDIDSVGLLVLTQDGRVAKSLIGDKSDVDKEYLVRVEGSLSDEGLALLNHGLELDGMPLRPAQVAWQNQDQLRFVLREGKKRQIRRMCELVGLHVVGLKRIRIGQVQLGNLPEGQWRYLDEHESF